MFKARGPFQIPVSSHIRRSIGKMDVEEIKELKELRENQSNFRGEGQVGGMKETIRTPPPTSGPSSIDERFCFTLDEQVAEQEDDTLLWNYTISNQVSNEYGKKLIFREQEYCLRGISDQGIVDTIYLIAENIPGYKSKTGVVTNRVCALHLVHLDTIVDDADMKSYSCIYRQTQDVAWDIPAEVTALRFKIQADDDMIKAPLGIPFICQFDIRHMGK